MDSPVCMAHVFKSSNSACYWKPMQSLKYSYCYPIMSISLFFPFCIFIFLSCFCHTWHFILHQLEPLIHFLWSFKQEEIAVSHINSGGYKSVHIHKYFTCFFADNGANETKRWSNVWHTLITSYVLSCPSIGRNERWESWLSFLWNSNLAVNGEGDVSLIIMICWRRLER